jgi:adenine C2-methylase RlmN of 23S rRNA A2503 and tRNA A37
MEQQHSATATILFKHSLLYQMLTCRNADRYTCASELKEQFDQCLQADQPGSHHFKDWREKLNQEMAIFNGKFVNEKEETASSVSQLHTMQPKTEVASKAVDIHKSAVV